MVFDELRRIGLSVLQPAHVLDAIEKDQLATLVEPDRVAGLIALLRGAKLFSGSLVVQVARKGRGAQAKTQKIKIAAFVEVTGWRTVGTKLFDYSKSVEVEWAHKEEEREKPPQTELF